MTTDAELKDRFDGDLPAFVCEATAPEYLAKLLFLVLKDSDELAGVPPAERMERLNQLAAELGATKASS